jgi:hypothetical protein
MTIQLRKIWFFDIVGFKSLMARADAADGVSHSDLFSVVSLLGSEKDRVERIKYGSKICPQAPYLQPDVDFHNTQQFDCAVVSACGSRDRTGLYRQSPRNGNIRALGRRLSTIFTLVWRTGSLETKSNTRNARISGPFVRFSGSLTKRQTAWLTWEDSNLHIPDRKMPFEMSGNFRTFPRNLGLETFAAGS